jgi:hypothetical protein
LGLAVTGLYEWYYTIGLRTSSQCRGSCKRNLLNLVSGGYHHHVAVPVATWLNEAYLDLQQSHSWRYITLFGVCLTINLAFLGTTHHAWIGGFFIVGSGAHAALFLVADYRAWSLPGLERVLAHRHSVIVYLNWASIFLGFHAFGMYIHNDTLSDVFTLNWVWAIGLVNHLRGV